MVSNVKESAGSDSKKFLDLLLAQNEIIEKNKENVPFAQGQLSAYKNILQEKLQHDKLDALLNEQSKFIRMESQLFFSQSQE